MRQSGCLAAAEAREEPAGDGGVALVVAAVDGAQVGLLHEADLDLERDEQGG